MKNRIQYLFYIFSLFTASALSAQTPQELSGEMLSKLQNCDSSHPLLHAFDGKLDTYYHSCANITSGDWIGLDLGKKHVISSIAYAPRIDNDYRERIQLGIFEGANEPDFGDAIPLFIVSGPAERELTVRQINCSRAFRYVRFIFPAARQSGKSSYVSELKFYGYESEGDESRLPQLTNLPTISIRTVDARDITSKEEYVKGVISIVYADGTKFYTDSLDIRGRGNNSWSHPKKPYRIKLANSTRLMGLPAKARNWTLINNYGDKTLMRNIVAFDFSRRLEMPYTSPAEAVDVVLNGDYKGCYQLCDHIDVRKNRVDIDEMSPTDLTGGYHIEIDAYASSEKNWFTSSAYGIPVTIKDPGDADLTSAQKNYIESHFNKMVSAAQSSNYKNAQTGFRKYMDMETFLRHFLVGEYAGNTDTYWSVRMYKQRNDDKFYFGPSWDFDLGFENDHRTYPINNKTEWICFYTGGTVDGSWQNGSSAAGGTRDFVRRIFSDDAVVEQLREIYSYYRDRNIISGEALTQVVDSCSAMLELAQDLNFKRWNIMNVKVHENPVVHGSYEAEVENVRNYVSNRVEWMDCKLNYIPSAIPNGVYEQQTGVNAKIWTNKNFIYLNSQDIFRVTISDISGKILRQETLCAGSYGLPMNAGIYLVTLRNGQGETKTYKCVVP